MVCSRIQWIANVFKVFNNFSLFWTVRFLDISPLMRFVPFLSGLTSSVCSTLPHFVDQHQQFLKRCMYLIQIVKYVKRQTGQKIDKINYCAQWWTRHHRDLEVAVKEQF